MSRTEPKHEASANGNQKFPEEGEDNPSDGQNVRSQPPVPLRPGEVIDLSRAAPGSPEQHFQFEPGAPLPNRAARFALADSPDTGPDLRPDVRPDLRQVPAPNPRRRNTFPTAAPQSALPALPARQRALPAPSARALPKPQPLPPPEPLQSLARPGSQTTHVRKDYTVANVDTLLKEAMQIDGAIGVSLVDYTSGMTLGQAGGGSMLNMDVASAGNTEVVRAKLRTMEALGLREGIEDILITLDTQYHIIRLISSQSGIGLFLYLALNKQQANLAMARHKLSNLERQIEI
jgi:hypothetical protein